MSPEYKNKADSFKGGVGEDYRYIISDISNNKKKYILVSFFREFLAVTPDFLKGRETVFLDTTSHDPYKPLIHKLDDIPPFKFSEVNPKLVIPASADAGSLLQPNTTYNILSEYLQFDNVRPIISNGPNKALTISSNDNEIVIKFDIADCPNFGNQEFIMALLKYIPREDWSVFWANGYTLSFEIESAELFAIQLEIKDSLQNKFVDKKIVLSESPIKQAFPLQRLTRRVDSWKDIGELCFTIFMNSDYFHDLKGTVRISNLRFELTA